MTATRKPGGGRKPLPTQLKIIKGTDQPCRINKREPKPKTDRVKMPAGLSSGAKKHWKFVYHQLLDARIITNIDVTAFGAYCEAYSQWREATDKVIAQGTVIKDSMGLSVKNPQFSIAQKTFENMKSMWTEFGMTPSSRSRIIAVGEAEKGNPFASNGRKAG